MDATTQAQTLEMAQIAQDRFAGLAFPVVKVRYAGPSNTLGTRYIASVQRDNITVRTPHHYDYALSGAENAFRAARKCWCEYQTRRMTHIADDPRVLIPGDLSDDTYTFTVVPLAFLGSATIQTSAAAL